MYEPAVVLTVFCSILQNFMHCFEQVHHIPVVHLSVFQTSASSYKIGNKDIGIGGALL